MNRLLNVIIGTAISLIIFEVINIISKNKDNNIILSKIYTIFKVLFWILELIVIFLLYGVGIEYFKDGDKLNGVKLILIGIFVTINILFKIYSIIKKRKSVSRN